MSSTGDRAANSRWRPTLPAPLRPTIATRGLGRWAACQSGLGLAMIVLTGLLGFAGRLVSPDRRATMLDAIFLTMLALVATAVVATWWWTWRCVKTEARAERG